MPPPAWLAGPNDWLLGTDLLRRAWRIAKNTFLANEQDLRDWMAPNPDVAELGAKVTAPGGADAEYKARLDTDVMWIDYVADTGDDVETMQLLSSWFLADLWTDGATVARAASATHATALPAGAVLLLGGDTAYHVADEATLRQRFADPIKVGYAEAGKPVRPRQLFAIPGNHDYYDHLVGFNRLVRRAIPGTTNVLELPTVIARTQGASYTKLLLPHGWQLWGVDLGPHGLDARQRAYFCPLDVVDPPAKLILCTPSPPVVHHHVATKGEADGAYRELVGSTPPEWMARPTTDGAARDRALLHLAGDVHHYARYTAELTRAGATTSVTCVVSGGGGAMLHPPVARLGSITPRLTYPPPRAAWREIGRELLLSPRAWWSGRLLWVLIAAMMALAYATRPGDAFDLVPPAILFGTTVVTAAVAIAIAFWMSRIKQRIKAEGRRGLGWPDDGDGRAPPATSVAKLIAYRQAVLALLVVAIVAFLVHPFLAHAWWDAINPVAPASVAVFTFGAMVIAVVVVLGGVAARDQRTGARKLVFLPLAIVHAVVELAPPGIAVLSRSWLAFAVYVAGAIAVSAIVRTLLVRGVERVSRFALIALWLAPAIAFAGLVRWDALDLFAPWSLALTGVIAGLAMIHAMVQLPLFLLVALAFGGHINEVAGTTRITKFKQWIRLAVTPAGVTAYVIGIDAMVERDTKTEASTASVPRIVDTFTISTTS
jgi:hypothetical protein